MQSNHVDEQKGDCIYSYGPIATLPTIIYYHPMTLGGYLTVQLPVDALIQAQSLQPPVLAQWDGEFENDGQRHQHNVSGIILVHCNSIVYHSINTTNIYLHHQ